MAESSKHICKLDLNKDLHGRVQAYQSLHPWPSHLLIKSKEDKMCVGLSKTHVEGLGRNLNSKGHEGTSLVLKWLRIHFAMQEKGVQTLVEELRSHMP